MKWVAGIVNYSIPLGKDFPHTFFELDTAEEPSHNTVLNAYKKFNLDVVSHRIGKGYHYFGNTVDRQIWQEWYASIKELNFKYPPLTLRVTKKFPNEVWERPIYHEATNIIPNWSKAVMHFLNKEQQGKNDGNLHKAMTDCGLHKYFKCVVYKVELEPQVATNVTG